MNNIFLNSMSFLGWQADSCAFWILFLLAAFLYSLGVAMKDDAPIMSVFINLLSTGALYLYSGTSGEVYWSFSHGYNGRSSFRGDNGHDYDCDGSNWRRS